MSKPIKVLIVEDNPTYIHLLNEILTQANEPGFELTQAKLLSEALKTLKGKEFEVILLDLFLPDSKGFETFAQIQGEAPQAAILVFTGVNDESLTFKAVQEGAQDYLVKGEVDGPMLKRAIRFALERQKSLAKLQNISYTDDLTGLYNRRGFIHFAEKQLLLAEHLKKECLLLFVDLDHMKWINDNLGHIKGDQALIAIADILRATFRKSDILARIGGDEFVILCLEADEITEDQSLKNRLLLNLQNYNAQAIASYPLSLSIGVARFDPKSPVLIEQLLAKADSLMYEDKRRKQKS